MDRLEILSGMNVHLAMLTCSRESSPRQDTSMWGKRWTQVRCHVHLSGIRRYHLIGGDQLPDRERNMISKGY